MVLNPTNLYENGDLKLYNPINPIVLQVSKTVSMSVVLLQEKGWPRKVNTLVCSVFPTAWCFVNCSVKGVLYFYVHGPVCYIVNCCPLRCIAVL